MKHNPGNDNSQSSVFSNAQAMMKADITLLNKQGQIKAPALLHAVYQKEA